MEAAEVTEDDVPLAACEPKNKFLLKDQTSESTIAKATWKPLEDTFAMKSVVSQILLCKYLVRLCDEKTFCGIWRAETPAETKRPDSLIYFQFPDNYFPPVAALPENAPPGESSIRKQSYNGC